MKIAIASTGKELSSRVDPRFGRAKFIIIYDTTKENFEVIDNSATSRQTGGAGVKTAEEVAAKRVDYVISQNFGPNALQVLKAANIKPAVFSDGTVAEAIEQVQRNQLHIV